MDYFHCFWQVSQKICITLEIYGCALYFRCGLLVAINFLGKHCKRLLQQLHILISTLNSANTTKTENWTCSILAFNGTDYEAEWNNASQITILNTAPTFNQTISNQTANAGQPFTTRFNCSDTADGDTITYWDNTTLFNIDSSTGEINDNATQEENNSHFINITCDDGTANTSQTFYYQVLDTIAPVITPVTPLTTTSDTTPEINVTTDENATCQYRNSSSTLSNMTMTGNLTHSQNLDSLSIGEHSIIVVCNDTFRNNATTTIERYSTAM